MTVVAARLNELLRGLIGCSQERRIWTGVELNPDPKALKFFLDVYSSGEAWHDNAWQRIASADPKAVAYAVEAGLMFYPVLLDHDGLIESILDLKPRISVEHVADLFLASLSSRRLEYRSALGSYAVSMHFPAHKFRTQSYGCEVCYTMINGPTEVDLNRLNCFRYKWGSSSDFPERVMFDLSQVSWLGRPQPTESDISIFRELLATLGSLPSAARPRDAEKALRTIVPSNKEEREALLETLGRAGIMQCPDHPGFFSGFVTKWDREPPPVAKINWSYPISWWNGSCGLNRVALKYFFGRYV